MLVVEHGARIVGASTISRDVSNGKQTDAKFRTLRPRVEEHSGEAHRTDTRCSLGSLAARCGWATYGLPCGPQPDPQHCSRHRGEGERQHRNRPLTRAILRRHGLAVKKRAEGCGGGAGGGAPPCWRRCRRRGPLGFRADLLRLGSGRRRGAHPGAHHRQLEAPESHGARWPSSSSVSPAARPWARSGWATWRRSAGRGGGRRLSGGAMVMVLGFLFLRSGLWRHAAESAAPGAAAPVSPREGSGRSPDP